MYKELDLLVKRAKEGDIDSKEEILNRLEGLIINSIQRYYNNRNEYKDLIQEGNIIILEAINNYNPNKGVYFLGYVKTMLKYNYLDHHKKRKHSSLNIEIGEDDGSQFIDLIESNDPNPLDKYLESEEISKLKESLSVLTDRQKEVIIYFYYKNMSIKDIGAKLGIGYRTVVNTKTRAVEKMREYRR